MYLFVVDCNNPTVTLNPIDEMMNVQSNINF